MGKTCGRREREADAGSRKEQSSRATCRRDGGKHPIVRTSASFAGCRKKNDLGRSEHRSSRSLPRWAGAPTTKGALWALRRGTTSAHSQKSVSTWVRSGTRPSLGPKARARFGTRGDIAVGQTCESGRNRHRGLDDSNAARLAACHRPRKRPAWYVDEEKVAAFSFARKRELRSHCPFFAVVAEVDKRRWVSNKLTRSAPKRVAAGVNRDLARVIERKNVESRVRPYNGHQTGEDPGDVRASSAVADLGPVFRCFGAEGWRRRRVVAEPGP